MTDLHQRFHELDDLSVPYLWDEIHQRAEAPDRAMSLDWVSAGRASAAHTPIPSRRFHAMNSVLKLATVALVALAIGIVVIPRLPAGQVGQAPLPSPTPTASPSPLRSGALPAGRYLARPFDPLLGGHDCMEPPQTGCTETAANDHIGIKFTLPDGWAGIEQSVWLAEQPNALGVGLAFHVGPWLNSDPCLTATSPGPDMPVGPTADEFAQALADHPLLDVTDPVDVTLAGYRGKYLDLQVPADASQCVYYMPWEPGIYAQGQSQRWHLWILDVEGNRVVVNGYDYPDTSPEVQAQLTAIVDSIEIEVPPSAAPSPTVSAQLPPACGGSGGGMLSPGRYIIDGPGGDCPRLSRGWPDKYVSLDLPEGWGYRGPAFGAALDREGGRIQMGVVDHVWADPCHSDARAEQGISGAGSTVTGPTIEDLVAALGAMRGVQVTAPEPVTLDGHAGVRMDLAMPTGPSEADCEWHRLWDTTTDNGIFGAQSGVGWVHRLWILDVEGVRFAVDASRPPDATPEMQAELDAIVESIDFAPRTAVETQ